MKQKGKGLTLRQFVAKVEAFLQKERITEARALVRRNHDSCFRVVGFACICWQERQEWKALKKDLLKIYRTTAPSARTSAVRRFERAHPLP